MSVVNANRKMYDQGDAEITMLGAIVTNWKKIEYGDTQENQVNHGGSNEVIGYSEGKKTYFGTYTLGMDEIKNLQSIEGIDGDIKKIKPFNIIVTFLNEDNGILNDVITCKFTGLRRNVEGMDLASDLELLVLGIKYNVVNV